MRVAETKPDPVRHDQLERERPCRARVARLEIRQEGLARGCRARPPSGGGRALVRGLVLVGLALAVVVRAVVARVVVLLAPTHRHTRLRKRRPPGQERRRSPIPRAPDEARGRGPPACRAIRSPWATHLLTILSCSAPRTLRGGRMRLGSRRMQRGGQAAAEVSSSPDGLLACRRRCAPVAQLPERVVVDLGQAPLEVRRPLLVGLAVVQEARLHQLGGAKEARSWVGLCRRWGSCGRWWRLCLL